MVASIQSSSLFLYFLCQNLHMSEEYLITVRTKHSISEGGLWLRELCVVGVGRSNKRALQPLPHIPTKFTTTENKAYETRLII